MENKAAKTKSMAFAIRIVNLYKFLCEEKKEYIISKQILRSGTSIGANIAEAECGISKKDFLMKISDCRQSRFLSLRTSVATLVWQSVFLKRP